MSVVSSKNKFAGAIVPAPWSLKGSGVVLVYFEKDTQTKLPGFLMNSKQLSLSILALVDYKESGVGPYREILYMPGVFLWNGRLCGHISKIFVDTESSVSSGIFNWGIPKELAKIKVDESSDEVSYEGIVDGKSEFFACIDKKKIQFPLGNSLMPLSILQQSDEVLLETKITAKGVGRAARLSHLESSLPELPEFLSQEPRIALEITEFQMNFPVPHIHLNEAI